MSAFNAEKLTKDLKAHLPDSNIGPVITEIGEVVYVGDGVCRISGLPSAHIEDIVFVQTD